MKKLRKLTVVAFVLFALSAFSLQAQNFAGIATYKSASKVQMRFANEGTEVKVNDDVKKLLNKQMQKEYTLKFNVSESTWKEVESLGSGPGAASSGGNVVMTFGGSQGGVLYKNTGEGRYEEEANVFGKPFLVKDQLETYEWQLTGESKKIGNYTCQKAIYTKIHERRSFSFFASEDKDNSELKTVMDTLTVIAWYTPEIPVTHGPENYWGLPGLILEVNNGSTTMVCDKVVLNPAEGVELEKPGKGKVVTQEEYDKIQEDKVKEMQKKFSNGSGGIVIKGGN